MYPNKPMKHSLESFMEYSEISNYPSKKQKIAEGAEIRARPQMTTMDINPFKNRPYSQRYKEILRTRQNLPAWEEKTNILNLVKDNQIVIVQGETGSGKTTQIPQFLLNSGYIKGIAVTQPRRVAAMSVSKRVSEELDVELGDEIGYTIRDRKSVV